MTEDQKELVLAELERVLSSAAFRGSRRSQEFLRYVVRNALEEKTELLKERTIGVEVFDRPVDYDTGDDSIVRVKANEVRRRLAQYYGEPGTGQEVQIDLPAGSYVPELRCVSASAGRPKPVKAPARRRGRWMALAGIAGIAAAVLVAGAFALVSYTRRPTALDRFWMPVLKSPRPLLLCVAHPVVYHLRGRSRETSEPLVPLADIVRDPDHYVGVGDALALILLFHAHREKLPRANRR